MCRAGNPDGAVTGNLFETQYSVGI